MRQPLSLKEVQWLPPETPLVVTCQGVEGLTTYVALREPSMRRDVAKLTLYTPVGNSQEEIKLIEAEDHTLIAGNVRYTVWEPNGAELESAKRVLERYEL